MINYSKLLIKVCIENNVSISIAESCTGGMLTSKLISVSGASKVIDCGLITYSNHAKTKYLNVPEDIIIKYGAVSSQVAVQMVNGLKKKNKSGICIGVTGIAGPFGGTKNKPVGTVYHSFYFKNSNKTFVIKKKYSGTRFNIRKSASNFSIKKVYKDILLIV